MSLRPLHVILGQHPPLAELLAEPRQVGGSTFEFDTSWNPTNRAFRAMAEFLEFDICELALGTYIQARAAGKPLTLLPVSLVSRFQHDQLVYDSARGRLAPEDLEGSTIAVRSYSQTTGVWIRAILSRQFGIDPASITWLVFEDAHVRGVPAPANVRFVDDDLDELFARGDADAAIGVRKTATTLPVIDPAAGYAREWFETEGCVTVNHAIAVREDVVAERGADVDAFYRLLKDLCDGDPSRAAPAGEEWDWARDITLYPVGFTQLQPALELIADEVYRQGIITAPLAPDDLVHPASRNWN